MSTSNGCEKRLAIPYSDGDIVTRMVLERRGCSSTIPDGRTLFNLDVISGNIEARKDTATLVIIYP